MDSTDDILERTRHLDFHDWLAWYRNSGGWCCLLEVDGFVRLLRDQCELFFYLSEDDAES